MTQEVFIEKARKVYGDEYDYSKVIYAGLKNEVIVIDKCTGEEKIVKPKNFLYAKKKYVRRTNEEKADAFIKKSRDKFGDRFDYSKVEYIDSLTPVTLICKEHGEFSVNMYRHLYSEDGLCPLCGDRATKSHNPGKGGLTTEHIIEKCKYAYGDKYDYSKVEYKGGKAREEVVEIICPTHGSFFKRVDSINKKDCGCPKCAREGKNSSEFIRNSKDKFSDRFDYSEMNYVNYRTPVTLICKEHGSKFNVVPFIHMTSRFGGCKECYSQYLESKRKPRKPKLTKEERKERRIECEKNHFIKKGIDKFGDRFDYSRVKYVNNNTPVDIIDKESNNEIFSITPSKFLSSDDGRSKSKKFEITREIFIERARALHGNKYDYSKVNYVDRYTEVCIICPIHGEFWQKPVYHFKIARGGCGCPKCANSVSKLERKVINRLTEENIKFKKEYVNEHIFGKMRGDIFINSYNIMIECQGSQHFEEKNSFHRAYGGSLSQQIERDYNFSRCCKDANIELLYYFNKSNARNVDYLNDKKFNGIYTKNNTFTDIDSLMSRIKEYSSTAAGVNNL